MAAAASATLGLRELSAARLQPDAGPAPISSLTYFWAAQDAPVPAGLRQQRRLLHGCLALLLDPATRAQSPAASALLRQNCARQAAHAEAAGVLVAEAPAVLAAVALAGGDRPGALSLLAASRERAPTDYALVLRRINIALSAAPVEELAAEGGYLEGELPTLMGSARGVSDAAALYVALPGLRPVVDRIADDMDPADRRRFLGAVRRAARG